MAPGVGIIADLTNAGISVARGNYAEASLSMAAAIPIVGNVAGAGKIAHRATTLYRAVSKAELDDIAVSGLRTIPGGYETGKLFATSLNDATRFGKNNFRLDGVPNHLIKVHVPDSVMKDATIFTADGMKAVSIPANKLNRLDSTPLNYSPLIKR